MNVAACQSCGEGVDRVVGTCPHCGRGISRADETLNVGGDENFEKVVRDDGETVVLYAVISRDAFDSAMLAEGVAWTEPRTAEQWDAVAAVCFDRYGWEEERSSGFGGGFTEAPSATVGRNRVVLSMLCGLDV